MEGQIYLSNKTICFKKNQIITNTNMYLMFNLNTDTNKNTK